MVLVRWGPSACNPLSFFRSGLGCPVPPLAPCLPSSRQMKHSARQQLSSCIDLKQHAFGSVQSMMQVSLLFNNDDDDNNDDNADDNDDDY